MNGRLLILTLTHTSLSLCAQMVRNRWGALKANMASVANHEKELSARESDAAKNASSQLSLGPNAVLAKPRASFSDSRFAGKGKGSKAQLQAQAQAARSGRNGSATTAQAARINQARNKAMNRASSSRMRKPGPNDRGGGGGGQREAPMATMVSGIAG